ncbi:unnamed protein product [Phyllotreta striolata]|uniref:Transportin-3 n=1 Tax=Phyllotreta striolata TaxID=444603 RepID=A0A9N9TDS5_PHYSR|nr:unnamed protein product [Phyllotreta striolata]
MDGKPDLEVVKSAVSTLYNNPDGGEKERASRWLLELQKSVHAWTVADELLRRCTNADDLQTRYFAAQTMRTKIHQSFHELPRDVHESLRDSLLEHMGACAGVDEGAGAAIVTQLSLALADLALQMPDWRTPALDLIGRFSAGNNVWPLLEVLTVLPEELESRSVRLGENRRYEVLEDMKFCAPTVNEFLKHCSNLYGRGGSERLAAGDRPIDVKILRCFASWISVGAIGPSQLSEDRVVVDMAFDVLKTDIRPDEKESVTGQLHEAATDCICTLLLRLEDNNNHVALETHLFENIVNLEVAYHASVALEDQAKSTDYCRLFTELAESFLGKIVDDGGGGGGGDGGGGAKRRTVYAVKCLDLVLMCVGHHDYEVAEITFNLWHMLSEELYQKNNKELTELFKPYVERLITALCRHCQMEPDMEGLLEKGDEFKDFRMKVSDLIKDVVFIVGSSSCFRQMFINLQTSGVTWDASEAALFVMQAVAKNVLPTENEVVPKVVEAILNIPISAHVAVKYTSVLLLGELAEWIEKHPDALDPVLNFLVCCLRSGAEGGGVATAAASALQNVCTCCGAHMGRHVPILLQLLQQSDSFGVGNAAVVGLLKGVASVVSCGMGSGAETASAVRELCSMQLSPLCSLIENDVRPVKGTLTDPVLWLDRLSSVLRYVNVNIVEGEIHPCKPVIMEMWPILSRAFDAYHSDVRIMERCCRSVRFMLRCVARQLQDLLPSLVGQIVNIYCLYGHSCCLYVGSILVDEYAGDVTCVRGLLDMLNAFLEPTFRLLQEENGLKNHPDTVDDFFRLCARFVQRAPKAFLSGGSHLAPIIQCALLAATLDHKEANVSVMKFFYDLINQGLSGRGEPDFDERKALVRSLLNEYGQQLVSNLIHSCVFYLHSYMLSEVGDVFVQLLDFDRQITSEWLANGLELLPKQQNGGIMAAKPKQLNDVHASITRSNSSKSVTHALKDLTRLYR